VEFYKLTPRLSRARLPSKTTLFKNRNENVNHFGNFVGLGSQESIFNLKLVSIPQRTPSLIVKSWLLKGALESKSAIFQPSHSKNTLSSFFLGAAA
jgi:hypothetical protein